MPNELQHLQVKEVSLVDAPANSSTSEDGIRNPHARVALWKRDGATEEDVDLMKALEGKSYGGVVFPKSDFAYTPSEKSSEWKLRLTATPGGKPDAKIVGAAVAALGKGFRGKRAQIPDADRPAVVARVRAAWKQANPDRGGEELPDVLKGELSTMPMTLEQLEKKFTEVDASVSVLKAENDLLKRENELVTKMSKKQRKAYASMTPDMQKDFMAGDEEKRKAMCDSAMGKLKEKAAEDCMDDATKAEFAKAGPTVRADMIAKAIADMDKKKKAKGGKVGSATDDDNDTQGDDGDDEDDNEDEETLKLKKLHSELTDRVVKAEAMLSEVNKRDKLSGFTAIAKSELPNTSGTDVEKGDMLMQLADKSGGVESALYKSVLASLVAADKALKPMFGEVGKSGAGGHFQPEKQLESIAKSIQSRDKISYEKAYGIAMEENQGLYKEYEDMHRAAVRSY
jgi:hypothetical protein